MTLLHNTFTFVRSHVLLTDVKEITLHIFYEGKKIEALPSQLTSTTKHSRLTQALQVDKFKVRALLLHQLIVRARLDDSALVEDKDHICLLYRT